MKKVLARFGIGAAGATALLVGRLALAQDSLAGYDYYGEPRTNMSAASCMPVQSNGNQEFPNNEIIRAIASGLSVSSSWTGGGVSFTCPLSRRNSTDYGKLQLAQDRILMTSLRISVFDGKSTDSVACNAYVQTMTGGFYISSTLWACTTTGGCTSAPAASFTGGTELFWTNPFGTTEIKNVGAVNVGYSCVVPGNSSLLWAEASYSPNN